MPLYQFECRKCKKKFSLVLRMADVGKPRSVRCPKCASSDVQKSIEPFFAATAKKS